MLLAVSDYGILQAPIDVHDRSVIALYWHTIWQMDSIDDCWGLNTSIGYPNWNDGCPAANSRGIRERQFLADLMRMCWNDDGVYGKALIMLGTFVKRIIAWFLCRILLCKTKSLVHVMYCEFQCTYVHKCIQYKNWILFNNCYRTNT